jgi:hypothetical protein
MGQKVKCRARSERVCAERGCGGARWRKRSNHNEGSIKMPAENDLEGVQDQGGKHGGQKGMPKSEPKPSHRPDSDIVEEDKKKDRRTR